MSKRQKVLVLLWGILWLVLGGLAGLAFLVEAFLYDFWISLGSMVIVLAGVGGLLLVVHAAQSLRKRPSGPLRLPPAWALGLGFVLALALGLGFWKVRAGVGLWVPVCAAGVALLAPLAAVSFAAGRAPGGVTARRGWSAFGLGATASPLLAILGEVLLPIAVLSLISGLTDRLLPMGRDLLNALQMGPLSAELMDPWFIAAFVEIAVIAPIVEELVKPLPLLPLLKRIESRRDAFLLGAMAGAGFAVVEDMIYAAGVGSAWGGLLAMRAMGAALHSFGAGLMAVAWWGIRRREPGAAGQWWRHYGLAVGVHAVWNGTCLVALAVSHAWFQGWEIEVLGITDAAVLVALLAAEGLGLLLALRALARQMEPAAEAAPRPALPTGRAVAVWGLVCLAVLLPVGIGVLETLW
jgi:hypothetical protein